MLRAWQQQPSVVAWVFIVVVNSTAASFVVVFALALAVLWLHLLSPLLRYLLVALEAFPIASIATSIAWPYQRVLQYQPFSFL